MAPSPQPAQQRTIDWDDEARVVVLIDQTRLPEKEVWLRLSKVEDLCEAIVSLRVRGAMALGAAGALGVALAVCRAEDDKLTGPEIEIAASRAAAALVKTRPTAINLAVGVARALARVPQGVRAVVDEATSALRQDETINEALSRRGSLAVRALTGKDRGLRILTHCNAGALAAVAWGSALGIVRALHEEARVQTVYACETRPLLQGARLTAWELERMHVPHKVLVDGAAAGLVLAGGVDVVIVGADRIAANGDTANKVGTLAHALAAARAGIPFVVAAPEATIDEATPSGSRIPIEERDGKEVTPDGLHVWNPAFDVTPADLIAAIVTEHRTWQPEGIAEVGPTTYVGLEDLPDVDARGSRLGEW